eukprot:3876313-Prorocentrum_lima.AAC.1
MRCRRSCPVDQLGNSRFFCRGKPNPSPSRCRNFRTCQPLGMPPRYRITTSPGGARNGSSLCSGGVNVAGHVQRQT